MFRIGPLKILAIDIAIESELLVRIDAGVRCVWMNCVDVGIAAIGTAADLIARFRVAMATELALADSRQIDVRYRFALGMSNIASRLGVLS